MTRVPTVSEETLLKVLKRLRDIRAWAVKRGVDPWAFRQALVMILELDTVAALERGTPWKTLTAFDAQVRADARTWAQRRG